MHKICMTALLAAIGVAAVPAASFAQRYVIVNPSGFLRIQVEAPGGADLDISTPIVSGRIELQEGPTFLNVGKNLTLTRLALRFGDIDLRSDVFGEKPLPLRNIGAQMSEGLVTWALEDQPNVFKIAIPHDVIHITGDPMFRAAATVAPEFFPTDENVEPLYATEERITEPILVVMDFNNLTFTAQAVFERPAGEILGQPVGKRRITVVLSGSFRGTPPFP